MSSMVGTRRFSLGRLGGRGRRRNVSFLFFVLVLGLGRMRKGRWEDENGADLTRVDAIHGGGMPVFVRGCGWVVAVVVVSGLKQWEDHMVVFEGLEELKKELESEETKGLKRETMERSGK